MNWPHSVGCVVLVGAALPWGFASGGCATDAQVGAECNGGPCEQTIPPAVIPSSDASPTPELGESAATAGVKRCPSSECRFPWVSCASSTFACDVNLQDDLHNCGACGKECGSTDVDYILHGSSQCVGGVCAFACNPPDGDKNFQDCDGIIDNGCEEDVLTSTANCGQCGHPCDSGTLCIGGLCGCPRGTTFCAGGCVDTTRNPSHCGACNRECRVVGDEVHPPGPTPPHMHLDCAESKCENVCNVFYPLQPEVFWADCDKSYSTGCEVSVTPYARNNSAHDNCGACGNACAPGVDCLDFSMRGPPKDGQLQCGECPPGLTLCSPDSAGSPLVATCVDTLSDANNCNVCGYVCPTPDNAARVCREGVCLSECIPPYEDCNGDQSDGCETDVHADPHHCGGCDIECDARSGQVCVAGVCAERACPNEDAGSGREVPR